MTGAIPLNERRVVTVLSIDVVGSTRLVAGLDPDDAQALLDQVFRRIQSAVQQRGGTIVAFTGDGALVVFGWPEASENHADNACLAAWEIQNRGADLGPAGGTVNVRIGVASGLVVVRRVEMGLVSRYDIVGDAAHRAAALQKLAPTGGILMCASTEDLVRFRTSGEAIHLDLGLRTGAVQAFLLTQRPREEAGALLGSRHALPVLGREGELRRIGQLLDQSRAGLSALACIGEPGLGKSRLAAAACDRAAAAGVSVLVHECRDLDSASPFAAARAIIMAALGAGAEQRDVGAAFDGAGCRSDDRAATLAVFGVGDRMAGAAAETASQTRVARALAQLLAHGALVRRTLLVVEDIHNLDPESRQVLSLMRGFPPAQGLAVFATGRPEAIETAADITPDLMRLAPLDDEAVTALLGCDEAGRTLSETARDAIVRQAAGNAFVLTQLLHASSLPAQADGNAPLPRSVESLIHARLDRLGPAARRVAQALGTLGEAIDADVAAAATGDASGVPPAVTAELERHAFIHPPVQGAFRFRHALIAAACASSVSRPQRQDIHQAALTALSARQEDRPQLFPRLAHHAEQAGRDDQAVGFYWEAARRARSLSASQSLMATFDRALACCERLGAAGEPRFVDLVLLVFETFHLQGSIARIEPHLQRAAACARQQGRRDKLCIAQCHLGIAAWYHGRFAEGERIMRPALEEAKALGHLPLRFAAQFILAQQLHNLARLDEALALIGELCSLLTGDLELARLGAMGLPAAIAHAHAGYYSLEAGRYGQAEEHIGKAMEIAVRGADAYSESLARIALGRCHLLTGQNVEAAECLAAGAAIIERQGFDPALLNVAGLMAMALSRTGRPHEAIALAEMRLAQGHLQRAGSYERHYFWAGYGEALVRAGRVEDGIARIADAIAIGRATHNPCILVQGLALKAAVLEDVCRAGPEAAAARAEAASLERRYGLVAPRVSFNPA